MCDFNTSNNSDIHNHTKCVSPSNQNCEISPTIVHLYLNEYNQELHYYSLALNLDKCVGSGNTLNDSSNRICHLNKTEDLNVHVFKMINHANVNVDMMKKI